MTYTGLPDRPRQRVSGHACIDCRYRLYLPFRLVFLVLALLNPMIGEPDLASGAEMLADDPSQPWNIAADKITRDQKTGDLIASGNVIITKQGKRLAADAIVFNQHTGDVRAQGHVMLTTGRDVLTGSRITLNLNTRTGILDQGTLFIDANHFYIKGDRILKTGEDSYTVEGPAITSCDSDKPDWKITGKKLDVTVEGYGYVTGAALWAKSVPVLYSPFLAFPAKIKRQTGLLVPQIGISERKGFEFIQPLYWAINAQSDATFYLHHMQERGEKIGAEYRYIIDDVSKGTIMADGFSDEKIDTGSPGTEQWGYPDDGLVRTNTDRYWFRMKHDQFVKYGITTKVDLDVVSDQDYLKEFRGGYTGFNDTNNVFTRDFGRGLDAIDDTVRTNQISFNKTGNRYSLSGDVRWNDDVVARRQGTTDSTLQTLPRIAYTASKQSLLATPSFFDATGGFVHFFRQTGARGNRADIHPRLYYPLTWENHLSFEPSVGTHATAWYMDTTDGTTLTDDSYFRNIYDLKLDAASEFFRVFQGGKDGQAKTRHTATPRVIYEYTPKQDQSDLPYFEESDRIAAQNLVTYSITNHFTARTPSLAASRSKDKTGAAVYNYDQFCRFELGQSYDLNLAGYGDPEPFSPIFADLTLNVGEGFALKADANWSVYEDYFVGHNIGLDLNRDWLQRLYTEYRYERDQNESIFVDLRVNLTSKVDVYSLYERNILEENDIGTGLGMVYKSQCWSVDLSYITTANDRRYTFAVNLMGLGGMGTDVSGQALESPFTATR